MKKNYQSQPPNFKYTLIDYIHVIKAMHSLCNWKKTYNIDYRVEFEKKFSEYIGKEYALSVNGCNSGMDIVMQILNLQPSDEVISSAINFYGTHLSILSTPAKLVLCEADDKTLNISVNSIKKNLTKNTKAVVVTHMNGVSADMNSIINVVKKYNPNIVIIEDVARSCGALYDNKKVGYLGDISVFSFQGKKNMSTLGEGGMILTDNQAYYEKMKKRREFGGREMDAWGSNYKLSKVQSNAGISQLKKVDKYNEKRRRVAFQRNSMLEKYNKYFSLPIFDKNYYSIYTYYTIILNDMFTRDDRDKIRKILDEKYGIKTTVANEPTFIVHKFVNEHVDSQYKNISCVLGGKIINLPIHFNMSKKDNKYICNSFIKALYEVLGESYDK
ncbi:MAG: aminotransferase class I/II-fold pyridoxal phosphate-dependent enzyme [Bacilli bacterium]